MILSYKEITAAKERLKKEAPFLFQIFSNAQVEQLIVSGKAAAYYSKEEKEEEGLLSVPDLAKEISDILGDNVGRNKLYKILRDKGFLYRTSNGQHKVTDFGKDIFVTVQESRVSKSGRAYKTKVLRCKSNAAETIALLLKKKDSDSCTAVKAA